MQQVSASSSPLCLGMGAVKKELFCPEVCDTLMHPENVMDILYLHYNDTQFAFRVDHNKLKGYTHKNWV